MVSDFSDFKSFRKRRMGGGDSGPSLHMDTDDFIRLYHNDTMHSAFLLHDTNINIRLLLSL